LIYDFFYYWFHRLQHTNSWLWEQHKLHHSDEALNVTTAYRINWLEDFFKGILVSVPMALLLGSPPVQVGIFASVAAAISQIWGQFLHSNVRVSLGGLTPFVTGPQYHRIHHSVNAHHQNKNFSTYLPIWDLLFGTYYRPSPEEYPETGVIDEPSDPDMREVLLGPVLRWRTKLYRFGIQVASSQ
jgi:sterol desaturase/sphingolipid hydroxylase (fatty acid hydroxylase superfamily)